LSRSARGLVYLWTNRFVLGAISLDLIAVLLGGATALLPVFARDVMHAGSQGFGILRAAPAIGGVIMALILGAFPIKRHAGMKMFLGSAASAWPPWYSPCPSRSGCRPWPWRCWGRPT